MGFVCEGGGDSGGHVKGVRGGQCGGAWEREGYAE